ncbi:hypothetical protein AAW14_27945 [Streptomyces hygroscopicus]|nr:hypothetical protein [Streptomyces hygroscopicus]
MPRTQGAQGFLSELQAGRFRWDLISPLPGQDEEDRRCGDVAVAEMTAFLKQFVDPARVEATGRLPEDFVQQCAARGYLSMRHPVEEGGLGLSALNAFRLVQTAASWSTAAALTLALHLGSGARACLPLLGDGEVSRDVLRACAEGVGFGDAGTEPSGAADTTRDCTADPVQGGFLLSGEKIFAQNASSAGFLLVSATVRGSGAEDPALFLVDTSAPGFAVISCHDFVGFKGADNGAIRLDRVFVPRSRMLSGPCPQDPAVPSRLSPRALRAIAARGRMYPVAAPAMAIGQLGVHWSRQFVRRRSIDGLPLGAFDEIQRLLAASLADVFVMESVVEWCLLAEERHPGIDVIPEMTAAKNITSRACWRIIDRTLSIAATEGLETASSKNRRGVQPLPVERLFRDARGLRIAGGADFLVDHRAARAMLSDLYATRSSADRTRPTAATGNVVGGQLTARNQAHLDYVARQASAFAEVCSALVAAHPDPEELFARQRTLILLSCISGEMFGMAASLARAARMTAEGHPDAQLLADVFCEEARHRIDDALRRLRTAREANHARACHAWLNGDELAFLSRDTITDPPSGPH